MVVRQGDVFWAGLGAPVGSGPGLTRPVVVAEVGGHLHECHVPGATHRPAKGLGRELSEVVSVDRDTLGERLGHVGDDDRDRILRGVDILLGRE